MSKIFLKPCGICRETSVHTKKERYDEIKDMIAYTIRCEVCGHIEKFNRFYNR